MDLSFLVKKKHILYKDTTLTQMIIQNGDKKSLTNSSPLKKKKLRFLESLPVLIIITKYHT